VALPAVKQSFLDELPNLVSTSAPAPRPRQETVGRWEAEGGNVAVAEETATEVATEIDGVACTLRHGSVVIAAITSCTNTSNPSVMVAAGLVARKAVERGLDVRPWVKTSLAPGSKVVTDYLRASGLLTDLEQLGFHVVGYGCTTCIGNSGPLPAPVSRAVAEGQLVAVSVLSGNRNFEGRISPEVRANYLASPPLVVAYALAGRIDVDLTTEPLGTDRDGAPVYLRDLWPTGEEIETTIAAALRGEMYRHQYADVFAGDEVWQGLEIPEGETFAWQAGSTYVRKPPYFEGMTLEPEPVEDVAGARCLAVLGDSITTDHISPAGAIKRGSPAANYLEERGVEPAEYNSYGSRRGNHEVMVRGTFANVRIRNRMVPDVEGGFTRHVPSGETSSIYDAAVRYAAEGTPLVVVAGKEYGSASSRDWAAKGPSLQGVRAVIAESYERIHRSNLIGMGIVPLELAAGDSAASLGLDGFEIYAIEGLAAGVASGFADGREVTVRATRADGSTAEFRAGVRLDTPQELEYFRHGGILRYVLRQLLAS
jgi:aconitate hydratase